MDINNFIKDFTALKKIIDLNFSLRYDSEESQFFINIDRYINLYFKIKSDVFSMDLLQTMKINSVKHKAGKIYDDIFTVNVYDDDIVKAKKIKLSHDKQDDKRCIAQKIVDILSCNLNRLEELCNLISIDSIEESISFINDIYNFISKYAKDDWYDLCKRNFEERDITKISKVNYIEIDISDSLHHKINDFIDAFYKIYAKYKCQISCLTEMQEECIELFISDGEDNIVNICKRINELLQWSLRFSANKLKIICDKYGGKWKDISPIKIDNYLSYAHDLNYQEIDKYLVGDYEEWSNDLSYKSLFSFISTASCSVGSQFDILANSDNLLPYFNKVFDEFKDTAIAKVDLQNTFADHDVKNSTDVISPA